MHSLVIVITIVQSFFFFSVFCFNLPHRARPNLPDRARPNLPDLARPNLPHRARPNQPDRASFSGFYGQRSVAAAWATHSPWSIPYSFFFSGSLVFWLMPGSQFCLIWKHLYHYGKPFIHRYDKNQKNVNYLFYFPYNRETFSINYRLIFAGNPTYTIPERLGLHPQLDV